MTVVEQLGVDQIVDDIRELLLICGCLGEVHYQDVHDEELRGKYDVLIHFQEVQLKRTKPSNIQIKQTDNMFPVVESKYQTYGIHCVKFLQLFGMFEIFIIKCSGVSQLLMKLKHSFV